MARRGDHAHNTIQAGGRHVLHHREQPDPVLQRRRPGLCRRAPRRPVRPPGRTLGPRSGRNRRERAVGGVFAAIGVSLINNSQAAKALQVAATALH